MNYWLAIGAPIVIGLSFAVAPTITCLVAAIFSACCFTGGLIVACTKPRTGGG